MHYIRYKSIICIVLACLSVLLLGAGCAQQEAEAGFSIAVAPGENPKVAPESLAKAPYTPQDYANPTGYEIAYDGVTSVTLTIGGESLDLKEAVQAGKITPERLVYQAELDAAAGTCARKLRSDGKLTLRIYTYPGYTMGVMHDLYVTHQGTEYLYRYLVFGPAYADFTIPSPMVLDDGALIKADREDWGISLTAKNVTAQGFTLQCAQNGVHTDGDLYVGSIFTIYRKNGDSWELIDQNWDVNLTDEAVVERNWSIPTGGEAAYTLSWEESHGTLESGVYNLWIYVNKDNRSQDAAGQSHGEIAGQRYKVQFEIP